MVDNVQGEERGGKVDDTQDNRGLEGVIQTDRLEDGRTVVEEVVVSRQLLQGLDHHTHNKSLDNLNLRREDLGPGGVTCKSLGLDGCLQDLQLSGNGWVLDWNLVGNRDGSLGFLESADLCQVTWGLWHEKHTTDHEQGPCETQTQWDSPLDRVRVGLGTVVGAVTQEDTCGNHKLETGNQRTSEVLWRDLRDKHRRQHSDTTDTQTGDDSADKVLVPLVDRGNLNDNTDGVDGDDDNQTDSSTPHITRLGQRDTTDTATNVEDRNHKTHSHSRQVTLTRGVVDLTETSDVIRLIHETRNGTRIPAEHETTKGNHNTHDGNRDVGGGWLPWHLSWGNVVLVLLLVLEVHGIGLVGWRGSEGVGPRRRWGQVLSVLLFLNSRHGCVFCIDVVGSVVWLFVFLVKTACATVTEDYQQSPVTCETKTGFLRLSWERVISRGQTVTPHTLSQGPPYIPTNLHIFFQVYSCNLSPVWLLPLSFFFSSVPAPATSRKQSQQGCTFHR